MQTVSQVSPAVAGSNVAASDGPAPDGAFPAAMQRALAPPAPPASGSTPPAMDGETLPAATTTSALLPVAASAAIPAAVSAPLSGLIGAGVALLDAQPAVAAVTGELPALPAGAGAPVANSAEGIRTDPEQTLVVQPAAPHASEVLSALQEITAGQDAAPSLAAATSSSPTQPGPPMPVTADVAGLVPADSGQSGAATPAVPVQVASAGSHRPGRRSSVPDAAAPSVLPGEVLQAITAHQIDAGRGPQRASDSTATAAPHQPINLPQPALRAPGQLAAQEGTGPALTASAIALAVATPGAQGVAASLVPGTPAPDTPAAAPLLELALSSPPGSTQFTHELGERLLWLVREGMHEARLQLNPRELGPLEIRLGVSDGAAQVSFSVQNAGTAAAVQQSLPHLRELLAAQGLQLGQAEVFHEQPGSQWEAQRQTQQQAQSGETQKGGAAGGRDDDSLAAGSTRVIGRGLVDAYA